MKKTSYGFLLLAIGMMVTYSIGCSADRKANADESVALALDWNKFILVAETNTEGYRGPVIARAYGYIGLAAYETALPGLEGDFISFAERFKDLQLPTPPAQSHFDMRVALNECYATMMGKFFLSAPETTRKEMAGIADRWDSFLRPHLDTASFRQSKAFGHAVATAVFAWSSTDSLGYRSNHHNYDRNYVPPVGEGKWVTSVDFPMPALLPYWGKVRPFIIQTEHFLARPVPAYSTETNHPFYIQSLELISLTKSLSAENKWIAEFWDDDHPRLTFTPAGHWLAITNQVIEKDHPSIEKAMETYLKVGFALADAMVACWYSKYTYSLERPESYIQRNIDPAWRPLAPSPSFPTYPSGHSLMGAATAEVLTALYGPEYKMMDKSHAELVDFEIKPRRFTSFDQMAKENALSRIILGVHWRMDAEEGLRLGQLLGQEVNRIEIEKKLTE